MHTDPESARRRAPRDDSIIVIAYGSLMSALGRNRHGQMLVQRLDHVRLTNCRRGFGKLSRYGEHYAMALEPIDVAQPIAVSSIAIGAPGIDALALTVPTDTFLQLSQREGYVLAAARLLVERAAAAEQTLGEFLWTVLAAVAFDVLSYRQRLFAITGYTSAHYIPHPVACSSSTTAIVFLAPGNEGSGSDAIVPVRVATGMTALLSVAAAWERKPTESQLEYFVSCLLAEEFGLSLADVCGGLVPKSPLVCALDSRLESTRPHERACLEALTARRPVSPTDTLSADEVGPT